MVWGPIIERTIVAEGPEPWALSLATGKVVKSKADLYGPVDGNLSGLVIASDMLLVPLAASAEDWELLFTHNGVKETPSFRRVAASEDWEIMSTKQAIALLDKLLNPPDDPVLTKKISEVRREIDIETAKIALMIAHGKALHGEDDIAQIAKLMAPAKITRDNELEHLESLIGASKEQRRLKAASQNVPPKSQPVSPGKSFVFRTRDGTMGVLKIIANGSVAALQKQWNDQTITVTNLERMIARLDKAIADGHGLNQVPMAAGREGRAREIARSKDIEEKMLQVRVELLEKAQSHGQAHPDIKLLEAKLKVLQKELALVAPVGDEEVAKRCRQSLVTELQSNC
jgi:hypothetical protein